MTIQMEFPACCDMRKKQSSKHNIIKNFDDQLCLHTML